MQVPRIALKVLYDGTDISTDISQSLLGFEFTDHAGEKADDLQITLEDRGHLWRGPWFPGKGAKLKASIHPSDQRYLPCGSFEVDEVEMNFPPSTVTIKAVSVPITSSLRREKQTRTWEGSNLKEIATEIATGAGLALYWDGDEPPTLTRVDQRDESNLAFLTRQCKDSGLRVKVTDNQIAIWSEDSQLSRPVVLTVAAGREAASGVVSLRFSTKAHNVYRAAVVKYHDAQAKRDVEFTYEPEGAPKVGQTLVINRRVESEAQARTLAESSLKRENRNEITGDIRIKGNTGLSAGSVIRLSGYGVFDGDYLIEEARHSYTISSGYVVTANVKRGESSEDSE